MTTVNGGIANHRAGTCEMNLGMPTFSRRNNGKTLNRIHRRHSRHHSQLPRFARCHHRRISHASVPQRIFVCVCTVSVAHTSLCVLIMPPSRIPPNPQHSSGLAAGVAVTKTAEHVLDRMYRCTCSASQQEECLTSGGVIYHHWRENEDLYG